MDRSIERQAAEDADGNVPIKRYKNTLREEGGRRQYMPVAPAIAVTTVLFTDTLFFFSFTQLGTVTTKA